MTLPPIPGPSGQDLDQIRLAGLTVRGRHGVFDHERRDGQDFVVDAVLHLDTRAAAASDDLAMTVHYGELAEALAEVVAGEPVNLIETLAERLASCTLSDPRVEAVDVTVHKPSAPIPLAFSDVAVTVRRRSPHRPRPARVVLALGANLGDRRATLQSAVDALAEVPGLRVLAASALVETAPVGGPEQPDYLNGVLLAETTLTPHELLVACQRVELAHGRERAVHWGPRTLDVDVIDYAAGVLSDQDLVLPHPRAARRAFVLAPWLTVDPAAVVPGVPPLGEPRAVRDLLAAAPDLDGLRFAAVPPLRVPA